MFGKKLKNRWKKVGKNKYYFGKNALLLECLRAFTGIEELCFLPVNPDYYIWTGTVTGIDGLKMRSNGYAGTWLLLQSESQVKKLRMLATIYSMDYPNLVDSDELARRLAKEEAAGQPCSGMSMVPSSSA